MDDTKPLPKKIASKEIGQSGVIIQQGIIRTDEYNSDLIGQTGLRTYERMRRSDATVHAILQMCKLPLLGLTWTVQPASEDEADKKLAAFVENDLMNANVNWQRFMSEGLTMLDFGYAVAEKTYELRTYDGQLRIGTKKIGFRKQTSIYKWETDDGNLGITQQLVSTNVSIPMEKLIVFTHQQEGDNYEGVSMLRYAYKDWYMKDQLVKVNGISLEKCGIGVPKITFSTDVPEPEKVRARSILRQFRGNEEGYLEVPKDSDVEMMDMKGNTTKEILPTIKHHDTQIALSVLGQFLMLGSSESGSRAVSADHSKLFMLSEEALANMFQAAVQEQWIKQLCDINFSDLPNGYPKLIHSKIEDEDVSVFSNAVKSLADSGVLSFNFETEQAVRQVIHLPELPDDYKEDYELKRKQSLEMITNPPELAIDNQAPTDKKPEKAALKAALKAENDLIDILVRR